MRRVILWIVAILITFAIGTGFDSAWHYLTAKESPTVAKLETAQIEVAAPEVVPTAPASEPAAAPNLILDYNRETVDHYGALYIMGPVPEGFRDFDYIALGLSGMHVVESSDYITVYSENNSQWASVDVALVTERYLYFTAGPGKDKGFQYRFEGEFLVKDFDSLEGKNKAAVRGKLTKSKNGRILAEQTITFRVEYMGC